MIEVSLRPGLRKRKNQWAPRDVTPYNRCDLITPPSRTMTSSQSGSLSTHAYQDPTPMPADVPKVAELGVTSAPLKSAAFFLGAYCKEFNGMFACLSE